MALFRSATPLQERLVALEEATAVARPYLSEQQLAPFEHTVALAQGRRALSAEHTVVGFFGATGSGKTSLFNAVVGEVLGKAAPRRPTTSSPLAAIWHPDGSEELLDWLQVEDRRVRTGEFFPGAGPLILLDLPDFDSVEESHRAIAHRLAGQVDVLVWVSDPEKYADAIIHDHFIRPHAAHSKVTLAVLNKSDRLSTPQLAEVSRSFEQLLVEDGLRNVSVIATSATSGAGVEQLKKAIAKVARAHASATARIEADLEQLTNQWIGDKFDATLPKTAKRQFDEHLTRAAGAERIAEITAHAYRKRLAQRTGWLLSSWIHRLRPDPLKRLGLREEPDQLGVHRTSLPEIDAASQAVANTGLREYSAQLTQDLPEPWANTIHDREETVREAIPGVVDRALGLTRLPAQPAKLWGALTAIQWLALLTALIGVLWYLAVAFLPGVLTPLLGNDLVPEVEQWPVPTLLILGGILLGIVLGMLTAVFGVVIGATIKARTRRALSKQIQQLSEQELLPELLTVRKDYQEFMNFIRIAAAK